MSYVPCPMSYVICYKYYEKINLNLIFHQCCLAINLYSHPCCIYIHHGISGFSFWNVSCVVYISLVLDSYLLSTLVVQVDPPPMLYSYQLSPSPVLCSYSTDGYSLIVPNDSLTKLCRINLLPWEMVLYSSPMLSYVYIS